MFEWVSEYVGELFCIGAASAEGFFSVESFYSSLTAVAAAAAVAAAVSAMALIGFSRSKTRNIGRVAM